MKFQAGLARFIKLQQSSQCHKIGENEGSAKNPS
jgi:hypothetical protein